MGESENIELIVDPSLSGMRLDAYLREQTPFSRSRIASLMEEGALLVNGEVERKAARKTEGGRISRWIFSIRTPTSLLSTKRAAWSSIPLRETKAARWSMPCSITSTIYPASGEKCGRESSIGWTKTPPA